MKPDFTVLESRPQSGFQPARKPSKLLSFRIFPANPFSDGDLRQIDAAKREWAFESDSPN
jgi:hypothetical protein